MKQHLDLNILFSTEEEDEFFGFENLVVNDHNSQEELTALFSTDNIEDEFHGFETPNNLDLIFLSDSEEDEFFGF